jgi:hypothetical protein
MEPILDKLARLTNPKLQRLKTTCPSIIWLFAGFMFFLPSLLFAIGNAFGYNVIYPPGVKQWPTQFEPEPAAPIAFIISVLIAAVSPLIIFSGKKRPTAILLTIVFWGLLAIESFVLMFLGYMVANDWQLFRC